MSYPLALIVEGYCEYESFPSLMAKIEEYGYVPISNAKGIGNIIRNTGGELLKVIKPLSPRKVIIVLDYREAQRDGTVTNCIELKELVQENCSQFIQSQQNGSLVLPDEIVVIIADKCFETWICADIEGLKTNPLIRPELIDEAFENVDLEIPNPGTWLKSKLREDIDIKSKANRKQMASTIRPQVAKDFSRSFRKFYEEIKKNEAQHDI